MKACRFDQEEAGFGSLATEKGHLPLKSMDVSTSITGLYCRTTLTQAFVNVFDEPLEATYIFPMPPRAAVSSFRLKVQDRVIEGELKERGEARREYEQAIEEGYRTAITEEERPNVFTIRVGNISKGEQAVVEFEIEGPLEFSNSEVTFRFPLVVAPRYIPGAPLDGTSVGDGIAPDTDIVPDASRITPPVLIKGQPNPVRFTFGVDIDPAGLAFTGFKSSLHQVAMEETAKGCFKVNLSNKTERLDRDFILRFRVGQADVTTGLVCHRERGKSEGTFALTVVPPLASGIVGEPRDVVIMLDRSGSMLGWKIAAARRAAGRLLDSLTDRDRFGIVLFDTVVEESSFPESAGRLLVPATDRLRYRGVEFLSTADARGGTEMGEALKHTLNRMAKNREEGRRQNIVLITDGQVGHERWIHRMIKRLGKDVRIFVVGIDEAVNDALLEDIALRTGGSCELVESESRLDEVMQHIRNRLGTPLLTDLKVEGKGMKIVPDSMTPSPVPMVYHGAQATIWGRFKGKFPAEVTISGKQADGAILRSTVKAVKSKELGIARAWARSRVLDLEHDYDTFDGAHKKVSKLVKEIVKFSLKHKVLCRFTSFLAVDKSEKINGKGELHQVIQPVEPARGWDMLDARGAVCMMAKTKLVKRSTIAYCLNIDSLMEKAEELKSSIECYEPRYKKRYRSLMSEMILPPTPETSATFSESDMYMATPETLEVMIRDGVWTAQQKELLESCYEIYRSVFRHHFDSEDYTTDELHELERTVQEVHQAWNSLDLTNGAKCLELASRVLRRIVSLLPEAHAMLEKADRRMARVLELLTDRLTGIIERYERDIIGGVEKNRGSEFWKQ